MSIKNKKIIAVIPARSGSKRLPGKNLLKLNGKPLINWTIAAAQESGYIDEIAVSTDSPEIASIAETTGITIPFLRPAFLSSDTAESRDVVEHTLNYYRNERGQEFDFFVLLQPTSPLRDAGDINNAIKLMDQKKSDSIISVTEMDHNPLWSNTLPDDLSMDNFIDNQYKNLRSQDLPKYYRLNGAIYLCNVKRFLKERTFFFSDNIHGYIMDSEKSIDIDNEIDFKLCEFILGNKN